MTDAKQTATATLEITVTRADGTVETYPAVPAVVQEED